MFSALWVLHLPKNAEVFAKTGKTIKYKEIIAKTDGKEFLSTVAGKITEIGEDAESIAIKIKFGAEKLTGTGGGFKPVWGKLAILGKEPVFSLNYTHRGKIIFAPFVNSLLLKKAATLKVRGIIAQKMQGEIRDFNKIKIPFLIIKNLTKESPVLKRGKRVKCLLDAKNGVLLVPKK